MQYAFCDTLIVVGLGVTDVVPPANEEAWVCRRMRAPVGLLESGDRADLLAWIKSEIMSALEHEVDECLYVDGVRVCADPHPELMK